jgi:hypothetical protein
MSSNVEADTTRKVPENRAGPMVIRLAGVIFAAHLALAVGWWMLTPKGFPPGHSRFVLNSVLPPVTVLVVCLGLFGLIRKRPRISATVLLCLSLVWAVAAVTAKIVFPFSFRNLWWPGFAAGALGMICSWRLIRGYPLPRAAIPGIVASAFVGVFVVSSERPPAASTEPVNEEMTTADSYTQQERTHDSRVPVTFDAEGARLDVQAGPLRLTCDPLLTFDRVSSDGFWSIFARRPPERSALQPVSGAHSSFWHYSDRSTVLLRNSVAPVAADLTANTPVDHDTFSHLNSYCVLEVSGHTQLSLSFSPCPDVLIDAVESDYPVGRPARFAFLDEARIFHVVEATSGEKGPFHPFASGQLERGAPLTISFHDQRKLAATVTLNDWSAQVSTDLSPTAGWGVPMNAIEFQRIGAPESAPVMIWITLAGTSVGRGWDTVGHRAGMYRNRIRIEAPGP